MSDHSYRVERVARKWVTSEYSFKELKVTKTEVNDTWHQALLDAGRMRHERRVTETIGFRS